MIFLYCFQAGISLQIITFSFNSFNLSILQLTAHSTNTLTVSWKEAADSQLSVCKEIFVIHKSNLSAIAVFLLSFINKLSADLKNSNYICENINDNEFFSSDENCYIEIPVKECGFSLYFYHINIKHITFIPEQTVIEYTKVKNEH